MKEEKGIKPVHITEDIWFYPTPKSFEFVVWSTHNKIGNRQAVQFKLSKTKIKRYLKPKAEKSATSLTNIQ